MSTRSRKSNEVAISVIIGTLLLILITVTAASALALFLSQMQKEAMTRQSHLADVQSELLKIQSVNLTKANNTDQYWNHANITILNLNTKESRIMSISLNGIWAQTMNVYDISGQQYPFDPSPGGQTNYDVSKQNEWVTIPATQARVFSLNISRSDHSSFYDLAVSKNITTGDSIAIQVMTSFINTFERTFSPPVPVMKITTDTQDLGVTQKTILVFDGTGSYSPNGSIVNYTWNILDTNTKIQNNFNTIPNYSYPIYVTDPYQVYGSTQKLEMQSSGPFIINLTVTDDSGLSTTSQNTTIGQNSGFNPPTHIVVKPNSTFFDAIPNPIPFTISPGDVFFPQYVNYTVEEGLDVWVNDSSDSAVSNQPVTFIQSGNSNVILTSYGGVTGKGGIINTPVTTFVLTSNASIPFSVGIVTVSSGKLAPLSM